jgi:hypothetical protein
MLAGFENQLFRSCPKVFVELGFVLANDNSALEARPIYDSRNSVWGGTGRCLLGFPRDATSRILCIILRKAGIVYIRQRSSPYLTNPKLLFHRGEHEGID